MTWRSPQVFFVLIALALAIVFGGWVALVLRRWLDRRSRQHISRHAKTGEDRARTWLRANGFTILGEQSSLFCTMQIDGKTTEYEVCADFVVERDGHRGIVEVKTGAVARPSAPATRRQIFEYASVYNVDRVYMFDGDRSRLHEITFGTAPRAKSRRQRVAEWQIGFVCGVGAVGLIAVAWRLLAHAG
jgi:hypothetical protein